MNRFWQAKITRQTLQSMPRAAQTLMEDMLRTAKLEPSRAEFRQVVHDYDGHVDWAENVPPSAPRILHYEFILIERGGEWPTLQQVKGKQ